MENIELVERINKCILEDDEDDTGALLTKWENDFLKSIERQASQGRELSAKQEAVLVKIEKKCNIETPPVDAYKDVAGQPRPAWTDQEPYSKPAYNTVQHKPARDDDDDIPF